MTVTPLTRGDLAAAGRLVIGAGWNQVEADWNLFLEQGEVLALRAAGGALVATAAVLPYPGGFGWISMVLVEKAWQRQGIAGRLLRECIAWLSARHLIPVLDATPAGRAVYLGLGFCDGWAITRWRRVVDASHGGAASSAARMALTPPPCAPPPPATDAVHRFAEHDWPDVLALDQSAFGADRTALLQRLHARSTEFACVVRREGRLCGYLLGRDGRHATQLGPLAASDEAAARNLIEHAIARIRGTLVIDALDQHHLLAQCLQTHGFAVERPFTRMLLGRDTPFGEAARTFAIAGPELG